MIVLQPLDVVVFDGLGSFVHKLIEWRGLDPAVHSAVVLDSKGTLYDPDFKGIVKTNISDYTGRNCTVHRFIQHVDALKLLAWCETSMASAKGYDYAQWFFGFVLGILSKKIADDPNKWTCAELPYWMFQENGYKLTPKDELLPMPRMFRYNPAFNTIYEGVI